MKGIFTKGAALLLAGSVLLTGCGKPSLDDVAATLGDTQITYGYANFYTQMQQIVYDSFYASYYGDEFWSEDISESGDGSETLASSTREEVAEEIERIYRNMAHADEYDVSLTDEELQKASDAAAEFMSDMAEEVADDTAD